MSRLDYLQKLPSFDPEWSDEVKDKWMDCFALLWGMVPVEPKSRRRCHCGCKKRATYTGRNNGIALVTGCELYIRRWVRDGIKTRSARSGGAEHG